MAIDTTRQLIEQIKNATQVGENTATRVGNAMEAILGDVAANADAVVQQGDSIRNIGNSEQNMVTVLEITETPELNESRYGYNGAISYTLLDEQTSLSAEGDFAEIRFKYWGNDPGSQDKLYTLTNVVANAGQIGYYSSSQIWFRPTTGATYLVYNLPAIYDITEYHVVKVVKTSTGYEVFADGVSLGNQAYIGAAFVVGRIGYSIPILVDVDYLTLHTGNLDKTYRKLYDNANSVNVMRVNTPYSGSDSARLVRMEGNITQNSLDLTTAQGNITNLAARVQNIESQLGGNLASRYGDGGYSYTGINSFTLANDGDYVEMEMRYWGNDSSSDDKLRALCKNGLADPKFGFYSSSQIWFKPTTGASYLIYNIPASVNIAEMHVYRLVKTSTGYEVFIDGTSIGNVAYTGTAATFDRIGWATIQVKLDIVYLKTNISGVETTLTDLYDNANSVNVISISVVEDTDTRDLPNYYQYDSTNEEFIIYVNLPHTNKYIGFNLKHKSSRGTDDDPILYKNIWEIVAPCKIYNLIGGALSQTNLSMIADGESECVTHRETDDVADFTGGVHGDETIDVDPSCYVKFYADGVLLDTSADIDITPCHEFSYVQRSALHYTAKIETNKVTSIPAVGAGSLSLTASHNYAIDGTDTGIPAYNVNSVFANISSAISTDNLAVSNVGGYWALSKVRTVDNSHTIIAYHNKKTTFGHRGYKTENALFFTAASIGTYYWYHGICCLGKDAATIGYNESFAQQQFTGGQGNYLQDTSYREFCATNATNKLSAKISSTLVSGGSVAEDKNCWMFVWDRVADSKYYRRTPIFSPVANERLFSVMVVEFGSTIETS